MVIRRGVFNEKNRAGMDFRNGWMNHVGHCSKQAWAAVSHASHALRGEDSK